MAQSNNWITSGIGSIGKATGNLYNAGQNLVGTATSFASKSNAYYDAQSALLKAQLARLQAEANVKIPNLNVSDVWNQSYNAAIGSVSPYYQRQLDLFLEKQNTERARAYETRDIEVTNLVKELQNYLTGTGIQRTRTGEDVTTKLGQISEDERLRQQQEAQQYDIGRRGLQQQTAQAGLTFSGLGRQQLGQAAQQRKFTETQQVQEVKRQKAASELYRTRTFEDLARGETLKKEETGTKEKAIQLDLNRMIEDLAYEEKTKREQIEFEKQQAAYAAQGQFAKQAYLNYLGGLSTAQKEKASKIYGGVF